jgi:hypothetical protein
MPPPLAPVDEIAAGVPVRPVPIAPSPPVNGHGSHADLPDSSSAPLDSRPAMADRRVQLARLFSTPERGIFQEVGDGEAHRLEIRKEAPTFRRRGWRRWLDVAIVAVFTGLLLAVVAALRFTVPLEVKSVPGLPANLTDLVEEESRNAKLRQLEAEELARAAVSRYLGAASEQAAASHLLPPPEGMAPPPYPPFPGPLTGPFAIQWSRRIAGTDRYLVVVGPEGQAGPVFVVEQTDSGPRLHAGAITQQSAGLYQKFFATPGEGEATLYTEVRPPAGERDYRAQRPDLAGYRFVDVRSAFPPGEAHYLACFKPDSEAARAFARRSHDVNWRQAMVQLRWQRQGDAGPFVELVKFIPGPWSGERVPLPPAATAANAR